MNLKKTIALAVVAASFTFAQETASSAVETQVVEQVPAPAPEVSTAQAENKPVESAAVPVASDDPAANRMGPPKTPFTVLHGNAYNTVGNEAAADNANTLLNKHLTKLAFQKFFYIEPSNEFGMISLGGLFAAMDISGSLGRATLGYATPGFAGEFRIALGQIAIDGDDGKKSGSDAGDDWGFTLSKILAGYSLTASFDWITTSDQMNVEPKVGKSVEQRYRDIEASLTVSNGPTARTHYWSTGVSFSRHENELEVGGKVVNPDADSRFSIVPLFNYGTPALRAKYANLFVGLNTSLPISIYDDQEFRDTTSGELVETSKFDFGVSLSPNILGEVLINESFMLFGEASYTWNAFHYISGTDETGDEYTTKVSKSDKVDATAGIRYQYKDWVACEFAFGDSFFTDTKSIFNGEGVFVSFGGFIYF